MGIKEPIEIEFENLPEGFEKTIEILQENNN